MIFRKYDINQFAQLSVKAVNSLFSPLLGMTAELSDFTDDYVAGQRFYVELFHPGRCVFFLEFSLPAKKYITEKIYGTKWEHLDTQTRDDCLLEVTGMAAARIISDAVGDKELIKTGFPMIVFDEYEDDLEVATSDFYRIDFILKDAPFAVVICDNNSSYLS